MSRVVVCVAVIVALGLPATGGAAPRLVGGDDFHAFYVGYRGYDRFLSIVGNPAVPDDEHLDFGVTQEQVWSYIDRPLPTAAAPEQSQRLRITVIGSNPSFGPSGTLVVHGNRRSWDEVNQTFTVDDASQAITFGPRTTAETAVYFDEITRIVVDQDDPFNMDVVLQLWWTDPHEQEITTGVEVVDIDEADCDDGGRYEVRFNRQRGTFTWKDLSETCVVEIGAGLSPSTPGMYFPVTPWPEANGDNYISRFPGWGWLEYLQQFPYGVPYFVVDTHTDPLIRPIVTELFDRATGEVIDRRRDLVYLSEDNVSGQPMLLDLPTSTEIPGAYAQLSPGGLDRLEAVHQPTLPYPIYPDGSQPRLSQTAIDDPIHYGTDTVGFDLDATYTYWVRPNPDPSAPEWAGYEAYDEILADAWEKYHAFFDDLEDCAQLPTSQAQAICTTQALLAHCVETPPSESSFEVEVTGLDTYFDRSAPDDALTVDRVGGMDLWFGADQILSDFDLIDIDGKLEGLIDPSYVTIRYKTSPFNLCDPANRVDPVNLADVEPGTVDREGWFVCEDLAYASASADLSFPVAFDLASSAESLATPFGGGVAFTVAGTSGDTSASGTCDESWMVDFATDEIVAWAPDVQRMLATDWLTTPSQDEALDRLTAPFELGIEAITAPLPDTPPYDIHPNPFYHLRADIGPAPGEPDMTADGTHGWAIPYLTSSFPQKDQPSHDFWLCLIGGNQQCGGAYDLHDDWFSYGLGTEGIPFDVSLTVTTGHLNQALWAQAQRPDRLGSPLDPIDLNLAPTELVDLATSLGHTDVATALSNAADKHDLRFHHAATPYTFITDPDPLVDPDGNLMYVAPNVIVEVIALDGTQRTPVARIVVDFLDRDLDLGFRTDGTLVLDAAWRDLEVIPLTTGFLDNCFASPGGCATHLEEMVVDLVTPTISDRLLDMIETIATPQRFDAAGESTTTLTLTNTRTSQRNQSVHLFADFCDGC